MTLELASPAFDDGAPIPETYGYTESNVNPPLTFDGVPEGAESLALVLDDPDAVEPAGKVWDHWVVWNIPPDLGGAPEDWVPASVGADEGKNDYGDPGYGGPNPPDGEHTYRFVLYALDATLSLDAGTTAEDLRTAIEGHVLAEATLTGTYAP
ncbi:MAG: YbhB/YbcL family Raf kinase inhibitor-like protein [Halobacteriaceae archaeon]